MNRQEILSELNDIFHDIFDDDSLVITEATSAADVPKWDSLVHISLLAAVEGAFEIKFEMREVVALQNVGDMVDIIEREQ